MGAEHRVAKRHRWRLPCEIVFEGGTQRALVLDLSKTGIFVQTGVRLRPGSDVEIKLQLEDVPEPILLRARVARAKHVPSHLTTVARGGVGLQLREAPPKYYEAIAALESGKPLRANVPIDGAETTQRATIRARFRARVQQTDGPRSRRIELHADSIEQARALALQEVGKGWEIVSVDPIG
jgi:Tfp pilus assembly protein PilZ